MCQERNKWKIHAIVTFFDTLNRLVWSIAGAIQAQQRTRNIVPRADEGALLRDRRNDLPRFNLVLTVQGSDGAHQSKTPA